MLLSSAVLPFGFLLTLLSDITFLNIYYTFLHLYLFTIHLQMYSKQIEMLVMYIIDNLGNILCRVTHYSGFTLCFTLVVGIFLFPEVDKLHVVDFYICTL